MSHAQTALICVLSYLALTVFIAIRAFGRTRDSADFFVAGRRLGAFATAMSLFASNLSGFAFVGGPSLVYQAGTSSFWMLLCAPLSVVLVFTMLARPLRFLSEARGLLTLPEVIALRFSSRAVQGSAAIAVLCGSVAYLSVQLLAMAALAQRLLQDPESGVLIGLWPFVIGSTALLILQGAMGGAIASVATDVVQGILMIAASGVVVIAAMSAFPGGLAESVDLVARHDPDALTPYGHLGPAACFGWFLLFGAGALGQPHYVGRLMMYRRVRDTRRIQLLLLAGMSAASLVWILVGLTMKAAVESGSVAAPAHADQIAGLFLQHFTSPWASGLVLAGLLAAIMSSADSLLNVGAAALLRDLPSALGRAPKKDHELVSARWVTVVIGAAAAVLALLWGDLMGLLGAASWTLFASALAPALALGFVWRGATSSGAVSSILYGTLASILVRVLEWKTICGVNTGAAVFITSLFVFLGVSLLTRERRAPHPAVLALLPPAVSSGSRR